MKIELIQDAQYLQWFDINWWHDSYKIMFPNFLIRLLVFMIYAINFSKSKVFKIFKVSIINSEVLI